MYLPPSPLKKPSTSTQFEEKPVLLIEVISNTSDLKIPFKLKLNPEGFEILKNLENSLVYLYISLTIGRSYLNLRA